MGGAVKIRREAGTPRHRHRHRRRHPHKDRREDVGVGVVECELNGVHCKTVGISETVQGRDTDCFCRQLRGYSIIESGFIFTVKPVSDSE